MVISILFAFAWINISLQLEGSNVCTAPNNASDAFCCYNFEEVNGTCIECRIGYTSREGTPCTPCGKKQYGPRCVFSCDCSAENCDPVLGCITSTQNTIHGSSADNVTEKAIVVASTSEISVTVIYVKDRINAEQTTNNDNIYVTKVTAKNGMNDKQPTKNDSIYGLSEREWILYPLCVVLLILIIGATSAWRKFRRRISHKINTHSLTDETQENHEDNEMQEMVIYHEIDESMLLDLDNKTLNTIDFDFFGGAQSASPDTIDLHDTGSYLTPYHEKEENISCHTCQLKHSSLAQVIESEDSSTSTEENTGYLNPYQPLQSNWQEHSHGYSHTTSIPIPCNLVINASPGHQILHNVEYRSAYDGQYVSGKMSDYVAATDILNIQTKQIDRSVKDPLHIEPLESNQVDEVTAVKTKTGNIDIESYNDCIDAKSCM